MRLISAHDLKTGAAFVLPGSVRCVEAKPSLYAHETDQMIDRMFVDPSEVRPLSTVQAGSIVYVEWTGPRSDRWIKLRVLRTE
jgi:hypothetical protein